MSTFELKINKEEVLRYLGYKGQEIDEKMDHMINTSREEVKNIITPRVLYEYKSISNSEKGIEVSGTNLILPGNDIKKTFKCF